MPEIDSHLLQPTSFSGTLRQPPANIWWSGVTRPLGSPPTTSVQSPASSTSWPASESHLEWAGRVKAAGSRLRFGLGDGDCKLDLDPSQASHQVLTYRRALPSVFLGYLEEDGIGDGVCEEDVVNVHRNWSAQPRIQRPIGSMEDQLGHLPLAQSPLNRNLLRVYFNILSRFKASLNGDPDPNNPFVRHYAPFCLQDPVVVQIVMYASACYLHETGHISRTALMMSKGHAIQMLNRRISLGQGPTGTGTTTGNAEHAGAVEETSCGGRTGDAAVAGVIQLAAAEWYWGENENDIQHHLRGLRNMIRLRGGFERLGMNGILAKNAICHDVSIALAHENSPLLLPSAQARGCGDSEFSWPSWAAEYAFVDPIKHVPLRPSHWAPFVYSLPHVGALPTFAECALFLGIHQATASILDNVRFLGKTVDAAFGGATDVNDATNETTTTTRTTSRKIRLTARYIYEHLTGLHPAIPGHRTSVSTLSTSGTSPRDDYFPGGRHEGSTRSGSLSSAGTGALATGGPDRSPSAPESDSTTTPEWSSTADASNPSTSPEAASQQQQQQQQQHASPDYMYQAIRLAAIVYSRAIMNRVPLSEACSQLEFLQIWTTTWRVPLSTWNAAVGIFHWIMLSIAPTCLTTPHARFVKNMLMVSTLALGVENWAVLMGAARAGLRMQHWLKDVEGDSKDNTDDEEGGRRWREER
ncbi:hypothetical protein CTRI78_v010907 [Colletotrichum trifolii]|uniref:Transcription factor domain-containing protein n=1 Tax=Colletotrichum trifolii TaxID=5466 RepID=A0A4R8QR30_COLTR|nr:hypothetical protein CTRI78_v010907 [Colletotrichum trifolii]